MKYLHKIKRYISSKNTTTLLFNLLLISGIVYLCYLNIPVIQYIINLLWTIIKPFLIGFIIAYILEPLIFYLQRKGLNRGIALVLVYILVFIIIGVTIIMIIPTFYQRASELFVSLNGGIRWLQNIIASYTAIDFSAIVDDLLKALNSLLQDGTMVDMTLGVLTGVTSTITNYIIFFIVAVYISSDYLAIHHKIKMIAYSIDEVLPSYMRAIDVTMVLYIRSFSFVIIAQALMCGLMYLVVGHPNWLVLAILSGFTALIPYIGPLIVNAIALLTALNIGTTNLIILIILILIQSNVMGYVVMPKIFSKGLDLSPIAVIFGLLTGFTVFGPIGMLIAMPVLIVLKVIINLKKPNIE